MATWKPSWILGILQIGILLTLANSKEIANEVTGEANHEAKTGIAEEGELVRSKRSLNIPGYEPKPELIAFRNGHYMSETEEVRAKDKHEGEVVIIRIFTESFHTDSNDTDDDVLNLQSTARKNAEDNIRAGFKEVIRDYEGLTDGLEIMSMQEIVSKEDSRNNKTYHRADIMIYATGSGDAVLNNMNYTFRVQGQLSDKIFVNDTFDEAYVQIAEKTVFQATLRLNDLPYMPQFEDLNNTATLKITNSLTLLTRPMFRYCFGEFFFRSVVMEYFEGPILGDTIVNMAFLLEANEYNVVDVDTVMKRQAETGALGEYAISDESYVIYEVGYVPAKFLQFLVANVTRADRVLDTEEFLTEIGIPSFFGMMLVILLVVVCSWEGFFCRLCFEDENFCCYGNEDDDDDMEDKLVEDDDDDEKYAGMA